MHLYSHIIRHTPHIHVYTYVHMHISIYTYTYAYVHVHAHIYKGGINTLYNTYICIYAQGCYI